MILSDKTGQKVAGLDGFVDSMNSPSPTEPSTSASQPASNNISDPRPFVNRSVVLAGSVVAAVRLDQMDSPTSCGTFTVHGLLGHLLGALDRVAVVGRGVDNPFARPEHFEPVDGDWTALWNQFAAKAEGAWHDPAALTRPTMLPWAAESGALALRTYVAEFIVHTWELAQATDQNVVWDDELTAMSLRVMRDILPAAGRSEMFATMRANLPEEMRGAADPYGAAVDIEPDAPLIEQLVAYVGRDPR
jgi:uncharacterized protein (TIGR03086 family)